MHIGIDCFGIMREPRVPAVIGYVFNLIKALAKVDSDNEYTLYTESSKRLLLDSGNFKMKTLRSPRLILHHFDLSSLVWHEVRLALELFLHPPDIFFDPLVSLPFLFRWHPRCKAVSCCYGLVSSTLPKDYVQPGDRLTTLRDRHVAKHADKIIANSKATKEDLIRLHKVEEGRISVVYHGCDTETYKPVQNSEQIERIRHKYSILGNYIIHLSFFHPQKNVKRLVEAFCHLKVQQKVPHKLVLAGPKIPYNEHIFQEIIAMARQFKLEEEIIFTGYVAQDDLPLLIGGADLFVFPSLYEGFGIPPLEAMACGVPVVASNVASLPEVIGDAGLLVDPYSIEEIAAAMYKVISNEELRQHMRDKGLQRAKLFSWEKTVRGVIKVFQEV